MNARVVAAARRAAAARSASRSSPWLAPSNLSPSASHAAIDAAVPVIFCLPCLVCLQLCASLQCRRSHSALVASCGGLPARGQTSARVERRARWRLRALKMSCRRQK